MFGLDLYATDVRLFFDPGVIQRSKSCMGDVITPVDAHDLVRANLFYVCYFEVGNFLYNTSHWQE